MVKQDIIEHLTYSCGLHRATAIAAVNGIIGLLARAVKRGENIHLRGLGTIKNVPVAARTARDIHKGTDIHIPAHRGIRLIPSLELREALRLLPPDHDPATITGRGAVIGTGDTPPES